MTMFLEGLLACYVVSIIFTALGWLKVDQSRTATKLGIPLAVAAVIWVVFFFAGKAIMIVVVIFSALLTIVGGLAIGFGLTAYLILKLAQYILPHNKLDFTDDELEILAMGAAYSIIYVAITLVHNPEAFN